MSFEIGRGVAEVQFLKKQQQKTTKKKTKKKKKKKKKTVKLTLSLETSEYSDKIMHRHYY